MNIGVLITYHDERMLLAECLDSLGRQTYPVDEIIIYDDGSNEPASKYVPEGMQVRVIRSEVTRGPAIGRNVLLHLSQADYIHFHDSDDLFRPQWSSVVRKQLSNTQIDAVFTEVSFFDHGRDQSGGGPVIGLRSLQRGEDPVRFCLTGSLLTPSGTYRRSTLNQIGGYRETLWQSEDWDFHVRLMAAGVRFSIIDDPLILCRRRPGSRSQNAVEVCASAVQASEMLSKELPQKYWPDLSERTAQLGSALYQLGAFEEARVAFRLSVKLGPPQFSRQRFSYRMLGRLFGAEAAERAGAWYRHMVPPAVRQAVRRNGEDPSQSDGPVSESGEA